MLGEGREAWTRARPMRVSPTGSVPLWQGSTRHTVSSSCQVQIFSLALWPVNRDELMNSIFVTVLLNMLNFRELVKCFYAELLSSRIRVGCSGAII